MAGQRLTHPAQSLSRKVTALSDFEYRVWEQTKLSADDFGVLPYSPLPLRADNLRLRNKATERQVADALTRLVTDRLLLPFDHQGETYLCAPAWQTWQMVAFPRKTVRPRPTPEVLAECDDATRYLFTIHPGGRKLPKPKTGKLPEEFGRTSEELPKDFRPHEAHTPANADANANASVVDVSEGGLGETAHHPPLPRRVSVVDRAGALGLVSPGAWQRQHATHALRDLCCDWVCLPQAVYDECLRRLTAAGAPAEQAALDLRAWAADVKARWQASGEVPGDSIFDFWRHEWQRTWGSNRASAAPRPGAGLDALIGGGRG